MWDAGRDLSVVQKHWMLGWGMRGPWVWGEKGSGCSSRPPIWLCRCPGMAGVDLPPCLPLLIRTT